MRRYSTLTAIKTLELELRKQEHKVLKDSHVETYIMGFTAIPTSYTRIILLNDIVVQFWYQESRNLARVSIHTDKLRFLFSSIPGIKGMFYQLPVPVPEEEKLAKLSEV